MKKILLVHPSNELYGADKVLLESVLALRPHYSVNVWLPKDVNYPDNALGVALRDRGVAVDFVDMPVLRRAYMNPIGLLKLIPRFLSTLRCFWHSDYDGVYINTTALVLIAPITRSRGVPSLLHVHEYLSGIESTVLSPAMRLTNRIICVSKSVEDALPGSAKRISQVIHNGFEFGEPMPRKALGKLTFVLASRWNAWKGHKEILDAWEQLQRDDAELHIYGGPPAIGQAFDVAGRVATMKNRDSVRIFGESKDIWAKLGAADCVVVPSVRPDPLPTIAIESLAAGRAIVCSRSGGLPDIVDHGINGWHVEAGSVNEWVHRLSEISRDDLRVAGLNARQAYEERFTSRLYRQRIRNILTQLVEE